MMQCGSTKLPYASYSFLCSQSIISTGAGAADALLLRVGAAAFVLVLRRVRPTVL